ncbi:JmjC domain-containing protein [Malikia granosa]|uniref:Cupin n=1 Tax=Malikia granosa TaxID=263067 RepID=A0A2S9K583_9BURK|nr:cupin domain-containing protein [Malikia granosa]PRD65554.1 cupin [Malikia granosa]
MTDVQFPLPPAPDQPLALLGGLTPAQFMRRHWQKKPLLVKGALPGFQPLLSRPELFALSGQEQVESRLVVQKPGVDWALKHGPFTKSAFPPFKQPHWSLLVQGVDLHHDGAHALMQQFRFLPDARLDDLMISWASEGGGVGPHYDSYDVFLIQAQGKRRWRIGRQKDLSLEPDLPLKILRHFEAEEEYVCEPGDMLYLPPKWAHDGVAVEGECMTYSVGFRVPQRGGLAGEIAQRLADDHEDETLYRDPDQAATQQPGRIPAGLQAFTADALKRLLEQPEDMARALGEVMTEPKPKVWFDEPEADWTPGAIVLDRRSRMMYDEHHIFINGEAYRAGGKDAELMRRLADERRLDGRAVRGASKGAKALLGEWYEAGWLHAQPN